MNRALALSLALALVAAAHGQRTVHVKNLKTLCVIYRGDPDADNHMDDPAVTQARNGVELGRLFYFRNSLARLNCEVHYEIVDAAPPDTEGPGMRRIEEDLKKRGINILDFDGLFVTGVGLAGNWGGFTLTGGVAGCFGGHGIRGDLSWYPENDPDVAYGTAWNFVHEYQHAIDLVIAERAGRRDMLHAHPYADRNEPFFKGYYQGGEHWDWIACTFREFDGWMDLAGLHNDFLECTDADGDKLPDDDPRLPADEKRFGSDPSKRDSDGDGLDDLREFTAGRYAGSDPNKADTDGDGRSDKLDAYPLVPIAETLRYGVDKNALTKLLLSSHYMTSLPKHRSEVWANWNEDGLRFKFSPYGPGMTVLLKIDGNARNGFWEGGDTYLIRASEGKVEFSGLNMSGEVPGATATVETGSVTSRLDVFIPAKLGQGISKEINFGGPRAAEDVVDGLTLVEGRTIGLNFIYEFEGSHRALLTPLHTMYAVTLVKPADAPERLFLRAPSETNVAIPIAEVLGVRAATRVRVGDGTRVFGARIGPGPVRLTGIPDDGVYDIFAEAGKLKSDTRRITLDRTALPPAGAVQDQTVRLTAEPRATVELWWGLDGVPVAPLAGTRADAQGVATFPLDETQTKGWVVSGYEGSRFERLVFIESWPVIAKNFRSGPPDPRLPADGCSFRFEGILDIETPGRYTFELGSDDGSRLYIDDQLAINNWGHHGMQARFAVVNLKKGAHRMRIDYYELDGWAGINVRYAQTGQRLTPALPVRRLPLPLSEVQLFAVQTDPLGNRSAFSGPILR